MTHIEFDEALTTIGWQTREVARRLSTYESRVRRWRIGESPIPDDIAEWVGKIARVVEKTPVPTLSKG